MVEMNDIVCPEYIEYVPLAIPNGIATINASGLYKATCFVFKTLNISGRGDKARTKDAIVPIITKTMGRVSSGLIYIQTRDKFL